MGFIFRMIRFFVWVLILSWGVRLLGRLVAWMLGGESSSTAPTATSTTQEAGGDANLPTEPSGRRLVRDPVCGVHVAEVLSIPLRDGNDLLHFCSVACRDAYTSQARKFAANG
jgi:hypothetical protein